ncbi:DUF2147 domain-containing protein [Flagellimonas sp. HMM57]|uniref:DUF2147 domain-containing protein n=1 Tax=unclassified Flagellimonas TaxID=2644544 RepID=UPI0013D74819|nr:MULTISPECIES: DUF2147 domain-containing protein [unclassified Flagellimonas]UII75546.1 DUF2147 domain-containing protein [Flagellimonas sp. HMM57]
MRDSARRRNFLLAIFLLALQISWSQTVFGKWKTIDDRNGNTKAIVKIYEENGLLQAKILKILEKGKENAVCVKCKGELKDKPIVGMKIMNDFKKNSKGEYKGDRLFDPEQAMTFRGKVWLDPKNKNRLKVRGYLAFLYRTQTWHRVPDE